MLLAAIASQFADAMTFAVGQATSTMAELNPLAVALGPGPALLGKAALMVAIAAGVAGVRRYWRAVLYLAVVAGVIGAWSNVAAMAGQPMTGLGAGSLLAGFVLLLVAIAAPFELTERGRRIVGDLVERI